MSSYLFFIDNTLHKWRRIKIFREFCDNISKCTKFCIAVSKTFSSRNFRLQILQNFLPLFQIFPQIREFKFKPTFSDFHRHSLPFVYWNSNCSTLNLPQILNVEYEIAFDKNREMNRYGTKVLPFGQILLQRVPNFAEPNYIWL